MHFALTGMFDTSITEGLENLFETVAIVAPAFTFEDQSPLGSVSDYKTVDGVVKLTAPSGCIGISSQGPG